MLQIPLKCAAKVTFVKGALTGGKLLSSSRDIIASSY